MVVLTTLSHYRVSVWSLCHINELVKTYTASKNMLEIRTSMPWSLVPHRAAARYSASHLTHVYERWNLSILLDDLLMMLLFSTVSRWSLSVCWNAGHAAWYNIHCQWSTDAHMYRRIVAEQWNNVRWWQIDADRCWRWQTWSTCDTKCLHSIQWRLWQFILSRGSVSTQFVNWYSSARITV